MSQQQQGELNEIYVTFPMKQSLDRQPGFFIPCCVCFIFSVSSTMLSNPTFLSRQSKLL